MKTERERVIEMGELGARAVSAVEPPVNSWLPMELYNVMRGEGETVQPTIYERTDGLALLYPGRLHLIIGEPEAGKSQLATSIGVSEIRKQEGFAFFDFEDVAESFVERMRSHGASGLQIQTQTFYVRPDCAIDEWSRSGMIEALRPVPSVIVVDANTEALALHGMDPNKSDDWARLMAELVNPLRDATGAAIVLLDHVAKDRDSRGRFAIGTGHKLASVDVAYTLETIKPFGRGSDGSSRLKLVKDRPGHLRQHTNDSGVIGVVKFTPGDAGALSVAVDPPDAADAEFRPTHLMERISRYIEANPEQPTRTILGDVGGQRKAANTALQTLAREGFIEARNRGSARLYVSVNTYREITDPESDRYPTVTQGGANDAE